MNDFALADFEALNFELLDKGTTGIGTTGIGTTGIGTVDIGTDPLNFLISSSIFDVLIGFENRLGVENIGVLKRDNIFNGLIKSGVI